MRRYFIFALVAIPLLMGAVSSTSVAIAFPTMVTHFSTSLVLAGWVLGVYQLVSIAAIPIASKLSDAVGRKPAFIYCLVLFTIGSLLCSIAPNIGWLIFFRVIQGAGGGGFTSTATGIISDQFPDKRPQFIGFLTSIISFGQIIGPGIGGVMVEYIGWQSVFWTNVPIGIIALVLTMYLIKKDVKKSGVAQLDFLGVGLLAGFVSSVMISLTLLGTDYHVSPFLIGLIVLSGLASLVLFFYRTKTRPDGVVSRELLTSRPFMAANIFNFAYGACSQGGVMVLLPLYATSVYGMGALQSGLLVSTRSIGLFVTSIIASFSLLRWGYRRPMIIGVIVSSLGLVLLAIEPGGFTLVGISLSPFILVMIFCIIAGIGVGMSNPAANNACIDLMPEKAASITGLRQIARQMGGSIGIAVSTLVLQSSSSIARGFTIILIGFSALLILAIVAVFSMPKGPVTEPLVSAKI